VHLAFYIFQGIGIACAIGIRPFLPGLAVGALALGDVEIHFDHSKYSFLQGAPFLIVLGVLAVVLLVQEQSPWAGRIQGRQPGAIALGLISLMVGAVFFAGALCGRGYIAWPGLLGGALCAFVGYIAARLFLTRLRARLDDDAAAVGVPLVANGSALLIAVLSVVAPPVGVIALLGLLWLIYRGRGRDEQKYAGLRILR
jgi:Domain of unknown function (DUF4126)